MRLLNNFVLLKAVVDNTERVYKNTGIILGITGAAKNQYLKNYTKRHFEVVAVPDKLVFPTTRQEFFESGYAFRYRTDMELKVGDIVWVKLRSGYKAHEVRIKGEKHYLVHYADIFVAQRRNLYRDMAKPSKNRIEKDEAYWDVIPLNGNVICDKVFKKPVSKLADFKKQEDPGKLKVRYAGTPSPSYFTIIDGEFVELPLPSFPLKKGEIIQADGPYINVEGDYFHDFNGETQPVAIHPFNIAAVL